MSSAPNPLFQYFPANPDGRMCSTCQAPFGPKTGNSTMRRHLQRTHPQQMQQYLSLGGSLPGSAPAKVKGAMPPATMKKRSRKSAPASLDAAVHDKDATSTDVPAVAAPSASSSSPLAPLLPPLPPLPTLVTPAAAPTSVFSTPSLPVPSLPLSSSSSTAVSSTSSSPSSSSSSTSAPASTVVLTSTSTSAFNSPGTSIGVPFSDCSLEHLRLSQQYFSNERQWLPFHTPRNLLLALVGEVGELAELFQWRDDAEPGLPTWTAAARESVGEELSDVLLYLIRLSDRCGIDLSQAVQRKLAVNASKYPAKRARGRSDKYTKLAKEEGKEDEDATMNGEAPTETKKPRKKRKVRSEGAASASAASEQESKQLDDRQPVGADDRKEAAEANSVKAE